MAVFMNPQFVRRDYECTNVVACVAETQPSIGFSGQPMRWDSHSITCREYDMQDLEGLEEIGGMNGIRFYGYL